MIRFLISVLFLLVLSQVTQASGDLILAYITDIEGSRVRFEHFLSQSEAFELGLDGRYHLKQNAHFVFGGDAPDRYVGSRWVVSELVRLKKETPSRVVLILGNRDINKMRLTSELTETALQKPAIKFHSTNLEAWEKHRLPESASERLKFILAYTMGAPHAFELRRQELALGHYLSESAVTDEMVVKSFLTEIGPGGIFREFLELGQLAYRFQNTLFVHGGVTLENFGHVPSGAKKYADVNEWIFELNRWFHRGLRIWKENSHTWSGEGPKAEQAWLDYPMPNPGAASRPESVVTCRNSDALNNPLLPPDKVIQGLLNQGISRLVYGHTPTADYPTLLRTPDDRFEVVSGDDSYARAEHYAALIHFKGDNLNQTSIRGTILLDSPQTVQTTIFLNQKTPIGKRLSDGSLVLGFLNSENLVSFRYGQNFRILNEVHSVANVSCNQFFL